MHQTILIADFGSQYTQLIARRIRELNVYCEIHPYHHFPKPGPHVKGIILSGSPSSVRDPKAPDIDLTEIRKNFPLLGVCYGAQLLAFKEGGEVVPSQIREYGRAHLRTIEKDSLLQGIKPGSVVWMSHGDTILRSPENFEIISGTDEVKVAAYKIRGEKTYGIQFHPEVTHSTDGLQLLRNFVVNICRCSQDWTPALFVEETVQNLKNKLAVIRLCWVYRAE